MGFLGYVLQLCRATAMQMVYLIPLRLISNEASGSYVNTAIIATEQIQML